MFNCTGQSGIIYTTTIKEVETLTDELKKKGLKVGSYHAQMEPTSRRLAQE
jgi:superfamily II DNA helicase RecQ